MRPARSPPLANGLAPVTEARASGAIRALTLAPWSLVVDAADSNAPGGTVILWGNGGTESESDSECLRLLKNSPKSEAESVRLLPVLSMLNAMVPSRSQNATPSPFLMGSVWCKLGRRTIVNRSSGTGAVSNACDQ